MSIAVCTGIDAAKHHLAPNPDSTDAEKWEKDTQQDVSKADCKQSNANVKHVAQLVSPKEIKASSQHQKEQNWGDVWNSLWYEEFAVDTKMDNKAM